MCAQLNNQKQKYKNVRLRIRDYELFNQVRSDLGSTWKLIDVMSYTADLLADEFPTIAMRQQRGTRRSYHQPKTDLGDAILRSSILSGKRGRIFP